MAQIYKADYGYVLGYSSLNGVDVSELVYTDHDTYFALTKQATACDNPSTASDWIRRNAANNKLRGGGVSAGCISEYNYVTLIPYRAWNTAYGTAVSNAYTAITDLFPNAFINCPNLATHETQPISQGVSNETFVYLKSCKRWIDHDGNVYKENATTHKLEAFSYQAISNLIHSAMSGYSGPSGNASTQIYLDYTIQANVTNAYLTGISVGAEYQWSDPEEYCSYRVFNSVTRVSYDLFELNKRTLLDMDNVPPDYETDPDAPPDDDPYTGDPFTDLDPSEPGGGGGTKKVPPIIPTPTPRIIDPDTFINLGLVTAYSPSTTELITLSTNLWHTDFSTDIKKLMRDPMEAIISLHSVPISVSGTNMTLSIGNVTMTGCTADKLNDQYYTVNCGTVEIKEIWGSYLDYKCHIDLFLPFIGNVSLSPDDVMGRAVEIEYLIDILTGACVASVIVDDAVIASFGGNCSYQIPLTALDKTNLAAGMMSIVANAVTGVATGGLSAPLALGTATSALNVATSKQHFQRVGGLGSNTGYIGMRTPYITVHIPNQCVPKYQNDFTGYPSYITDFVRNIVGYVEMYKGHINAAGATDAELREIESMLYNGVEVEDTSAADTTAAGTIKLYNMSSPHEMIGKSKTQIGGDLTGWLKNESDIVNPVITIEADIGDLTRCNYFSTFNRFYYVTDIKSIRSGICEISGHVDALETFRQAIGNNMIIMKRQRSKWNLYVEDGALITYANDKWYTKNFSSVFNTNSFILIVSG